MANETTENVVVEQAADVAVETSSEVTQEVAETVEEKPKKTKKSSKKSTEPVAEESTSEDNEGKVIEEKEEESVEADEDAAADASEELNIMDDAKTAEVPEEGNENIKAHFYRFRKEGFQLGLDPNGFVSTVLMKKFRFGFVMKNTEVDFINEQNKCISYVKAALNKLNDPDIVVREVKTPSYVETEKFYNVISVHVPFHANINEVVKEMRNTTALLNKTITDDSVEFLVRIGNYADLIVDSSKQGEGYVCFKGFQSLTYSKSKNAKRSARETLSAGLYANETLDFKQKDISYVNKANLNVCKMNLFGKNVKFDPISHHDINFGKRFACIIWEMLKEENNFKLVRYICDINLRDYKAFGKIFVTDGVKTTIKKEEFNYGMTMPRFETIFQDEGDVEILCTMLGAPREDNKWAQFDNDVDIIDQCMFTDLRVVEE